MIHELKILPEFFTAVKKGKKTFEIRVNDRLYKVNDHLLLKEWTGDDYTGEEIKVRVKYILANENFVKKNTVVMAIEILDGCVYPSGATTEINTDYYEELKAKADKINELRSKLVEEHDLTIKKINKDGWTRYTEKMAYKDGLRFALDLIDGNQTESEDNQCT